ncbi:MULTISPECIES: DUF6146 family protein [Flavobacteriaceae]|uniref:Uncharacterized protein n=2 Tax=Flavobacteriaceae TaxID=49546 RepID=A0A4Y8AR96_9FLAO|nr:MULTISPECIES: DUF6146 family protein [Flavobacteriaceae]TEW72897.1 hypothetical protein E2488_11920 [Gramella jeungdoensis]GGK48782.1 hypothetical protein GCM10007963_16300 [Lutibacter litoralis]
MKKIIYYLVTVLFIVGCSSTTKTTKTDTQLPEGAIRIANDELEYEIIIIDPGFETYLLTIAKPANFYSQSYYETKNKFYVTEWNNRARNPLGYNPNIYENVIDYDFNIDYGLDVNYKLYNYFKFVESKYKQRF